MRKLSPTAWFLIVVLLAMSVFFVASLGYSDIKVKLMPALMSGLTIVLALFALIQDLKAGARQNMPTDEDGDVIEDEKIIGTPLRAYFQAFLWFAGLIALVYGLGFIIAVPLWMFVYLWRHGSQWWTAILLGVGMIVIIYLVFTTLLQIELYPGIVIEWLNRQLNP